MPGAYRDENGAALERVARLEDENARLRAALAQRTPHGARSRSRFRGVFVALAFFVPFAAATLMVVGLRRAAAPTAEGTISVGSSSVVASGSVGVSVSFGSDPPFDRDAAERALAAVELRSCAGPVRYVEGLNDGVVTVTFAEDGSARDVSLSSKAFDGSAVGGCIVKRMQAVHVAPFSGGPATARRRFVLD